MTKDEIIEMARQADGQVTMWVNHSTIQKTTTFTFESPIDYRVSGYYPEMYHIKFLERFANLVAAKEREALAQTQEPVAYLCENAVGHKYFRWKKPTSIYKPIALYTHPPQRTEPKVCCQQYDTCLEPCTPRGTHLAQRTWVGIEGGEIRNLWEEATRPDRSTMTMVTSFADSIEAKLKLKNGYAEEKNT
jgi:hypothetical protein